MAPIRIFRPLPKIAALFLLLGLGIGSPGGVRGQDRVKLKEVKISGNVRVEDDGIRLHLKSRAGDNFDPLIVEQDVKAIFRMGFFDDVNAELSADGILTYAIKEKPYIREVKIQGASQVTKDKIETALGIGARTILDRTKVAEGVEKVRKNYSEQGYVNAKVDYAVSVEANNQAVVTLDIVEGNRLLIKTISFAGNKAFSDGDLKSLMGTKEEWIFSFITNRGVLDRDILNNDLAILSSYYNDNGYVEHKIDDPIILRGRDGLEIVMRIKEGPQYRVGRVEVGGDLIEDGQVILKALKLTTGQIFRGSRLHDDITLLTDFYSNKGFAFAQVDPVTNVKPVEKVVDVALMITKGPPVYFNRVLVAGNSKTRDQVIRRELFANEHELYSGSKVTNSRNALQRTGYFEDVQVTTKKTGQPDTLDVLVEVKEGPTGQFQFGAGYTGGDGFLFNGSLSEKNLLGRGQGISSDVSLGTKRQDFIFSFNEPFLNDTKLGVGMAAYNTNRTYTDYDEQKLGFGVTTSYPLGELKIPFFGRASADSEKGSDELPGSRPVTMWDYMRGGVAYDLTRDNINAVSRSASQSLKDEEGTNVISSVTPSATYDSRDHFFAPTEGTKSIFALKTAGLGGNTQFIKTDISARWYYPLLRDPRWGGAYVLALGGSLGYGNNLPLSERYFIGGINTVRGFTDRTISPREPTGCNVFGNNCTGTEVVGGNKAAVLNTEFLFPIYEQYGVRGLTFFDLGSSFDSFSLSELRSSVGFGVRWMSPFGPLRVELGFPLKKSPGDETSVLGFSIGSQP